MTVASMHAARVSWTQTDLAELDIEDLLEACADVGGWAAFAPVGKELPRARMPSPTPRARLPRTSSLLQLSVEPPSPENARHSAVPPDRRASLASNRSSPVESPDPGFDFFRFPPTSSSATPATSPSLSADSPPSATAALLSLDDIFASHASPFPTVSPSALPSPIPAPFALGPTSSPFINTRVLVERFEANLPPAPSVVLQQPRRPSCAPSTASIASGSTGSGSFSGSSASTARAENRPLAMYPRPPPASRGAQQYPRPPPASRGAQQYPRPPPPPKDKYTKGRKRTPSEGSGGTGGSAETKRDKGGWLAHLK